MWLFPFSHRFVLASLLMATVSACDADVSVPELDRYMLGEAKEGESEESVLHRLGEPAFRVPWSEGLDGGEDWIYPIRCCDPPHMVGQFGTMAPAAQLKIFLDNTGVVSAWGFFHPKTGQRMEIRESLLMAKMHHSYVFHRVCESVVRIELGEVLKTGQTTKRDIRILRRRVLGMSQAAEDVLTIYVDRPSPLYTPALQYIVRFKDNKVWGKHARVRKGCH